MTDHEGVRTPEPWEVRLGRNPSYVASLQATFGRVLFYCPTALWCLIAPHLKAALVSLLMIPLLVLVWAVSTVLATAAGLVGWILHPSQDER